LRIIHYNIGFLIYNPHDSPLPFSSKPSLWEGNK
jgi:hypothetical protein